MEVNLFAFSYFFFWVLAPIVLIDLIIVFVLGLVEIYE